MSHGTGRHRRHSRGWISRARWTVGAILTAVVGAQPSPQPRPAPAAERRKRLDEARPTMTRTATSAPRKEREPEWVERFDRAQREHADRARASYADEGGATVGPKAPSPLPEFGWCVDDDGVRGVRPYLVAHEQRRLAQRHRAVPRAPRRGGCATDASSQPKVGEPCGEWDELAVLVRQWEALQQPVA